MLQHFVRPVIAAVGSVEVRLLLHFLCAASLCDVCSAVFYGTVLGKYLFLILININPHKHGECKPQFMWSKESSMLTFNSCSLLPLKGYTVTPTIVVMSLGLIKINRRVHWPHDASTWKLSWLFYIPFFSLNSTRTVRAVFHKDEKEFSTVYCSAQSGPNIFRCGFGLCSNFWFAGTLMSRTS
jgi:hypothetical protein